MADAQPPRAIQMAQHRALFQRAIREGVSMDEARRRAAAERWAQTDARLASRRTAVTPAISEDRAPGFWWLRD